MIDIGREGKPTSVNMGGHYEDIYVKTAEGWRIKSRNFFRSKSAQTVAAEAAAPKRRPDERADRDRFRACALHRPAERRGPDRARSSRPHPPGDVPFKIVRLDPALDAIISPDAKLETLGDKFGLAEGPVWMPAQNGQDGYPAVQRHRGEPDLPLVEGSRPVGVLEKAGYTGKDTLNVGQQTTTGGRIAILLIGPNALTLDPQQRLVICAMTDRNVVRIEKDGTRTVLADRYQGKRFSGPNDIVVKSDGAVYFTDSVGGLRGGDDSPQRELPYNGFYLVKDGKVTLLGSDEGHPTDFPNGIGLSPDEKYLYVTAGFGKTFRYDVQADDTVANGKLFVETGNDGLKVDRKGNLYLVEQRPGRRGDLHHVARGQASGRDPDAEGGGRAAAADLRDQRRRSATRTARDSTSPAAAGCSTSA